MRYVRVGVLRRYTLNNRISFGAIAKLALIAYKRKSLMQNIKHAAGIMSHHGLLLRSVGTMIGYCKGWHAQGPSTHAAIRTRTTCLINDNRETDDGS